MVRLVRKMSYKYVILCSLDNIVNKHADRMFNELAVPAG